MIAVSVRLDGITIDGHAGYAEAGKDIVCAGVTALTENLIDSIESLTKDLSIHDLTRRSTAIFNNFVYSKPNFITQISQNIHLFFLFYTSQFIFSLLLFGFIGANLWAFYVHFTFALKY